ncbi:flavin-containing monooxygenase [Aspergillus ibericus CBS 121593]|uniref:Putative dimethylaniline monooxygenase n=1 Tax=Aspergillus ibericus CBS 121593 TaxID=1448316 RepID=A0A395H639_9EURO|nr:putative dimethylaniline monooxygenase [Aspergillus ibericus CBS 121593]RAL03362.1 putative dimethylaniline monooxygenase [Aspergillus ibericus CBS 121593]
MSFASCYDIIIVGAGIAGVNCGYRVQTLLPDYTYAILEARNSAGGTWDLMRYPGVRLDSDIYTFGFSWYPFPHSQTVLDGNTVLNYINDAAKKHCIYDHILLNHRVTKATWSSDTHNWNLIAEADDRKLCFCARYVIFATGYFDYHEPLPVQIRGLHNFKGRVIHPQFWPESLDYSEKKVVVVGNGATAISLVPKLAETALGITIIQRSPHYVLPTSSGGDDSPIMRLLPTALSYWLKRLGWLSLTLLSYYACRRFPRAARDYMLRMVRDELPEHVPHDLHFRPKYNVWDQRLLTCLDGDLFKSIRDGKVNIETASIQNCTANGLLLEDGKTINADLIVTATGIKLQIAGSIQVGIDGSRCDVSERFMWKGMMLQGFPNAFFALGYLTSASWTMGTDLTALFACRLIRHMKEKNRLAATPHMRELSDLTERPLWTLRSTYMTTARSNLPKAGNFGPWKPRSNYLWDYIQACYGSFEGLEFFEGF